MSTWSMSAPSAADVDRVQHVPAMFGQLVEAGADGFLAAGANPPTCE
jgi:hypothetical protein